MNKAGQCLAAPHFDRFVHTFQATDKAARLAKARAVKATGEQDNPLVKGDCKIRTPEEAWLPPSTGNRNNPDGRRGKNNQPGTNQELTKNQPGTNQELTKNQPGTNQELTKNQPGTNQELTKNQPGTNQEPTKNQPNDNVNENVNENVNVSSSRKSGGQSLTLPYGTYTVTLSAGEVKALVHGQAANIRILRQRIRRAERIIAKYEGGAIPPPDYKTTDPAAIIAEHRRFLDRYRKALAQADLLHRQLDDMTIDNKIINQFKVDRAKYQERCSKNRDAAIARWGKDKNANAYKRIQTHTSGCNTMPNENENENVNENVNVSSSRKSGGQSLTLPYPVKVMTYNVRSWYRDTRPLPTNWRRRAEAIKALIATAAPDVLLLQETLWPMTSRCVPDNYDKASGCSISHHIYLRREFAVVEGHEWHVHWTRARLRLPNASRWEVVSVHGHWNAAKTARLAAAIKGIKLNGAALICGGDWNNDPATMRPALFPVAVKATDGTTFRNWESGTTAELDYFAGYAITGAQVRIVPGSSFQDSDHLPVMIELP